MTQQFLKDHSMDCHETALKIAGLSGLFFTKEKDEYFIRYMVQKLINVSVCGKPSSRDKLPDVKFFELAVGLVRPASPTLYFI